MLVADPRVSAITLRGCMQDLGVPARIRTALGVLNGLLSSVLTDAVNLGRQRSTGGRVDGG